MLLNTALQHNQDCQREINELAEYYALQLENMHLDGRQVSGADHAKIAALGAELLFQLSEKYQEAIHDAEAEAEAFAERQAAEVELAYMAADREID
jgi:hypothetical protein